MVTEFDKFCTSHACATYCKGQANYCPYADDMRARHMHIDWRFCELRYNKEHGIAQQDAPAKKKRR